MIFVILLYNAYGQRSVPLLGPTKVQANFVDIVPQKLSLRLSLNIPFNEVIDLKGICRNVKGLGWWGNREVEIMMKDSSRLGSIMKFT